MIPGFGRLGASDLFLFPDPSTLSLLPWRPNHGRVARFYSAIKHSDGSPYALDCRGILKNAVSAAKDAGINASFGSEGQFYLFKAGSDGYPSGIPLDMGGYMDIAPIDKGENVRREICLTLSDMGLYPETSRHQAGPGQNEITFRYGGAVECADNFVTFRNVVRTIADKNGIFASFDALPIKTSPRNSFHINISLSGNDNETRKSFIAGILSHIPECTLFLNPISDSYIDTGDSHSPKYITWSSESRAALVRVPEPENSAGRFEIRSPDTMANPYIAFALMLYSGIDGVNKKLVLQPESRHSEIISCTRGLKRLPENLPAAQSKAEASKFLRSVLPIPLIDAYLEV
jgi:glutamine synthetase